MLTDAGSWAVRVHRKLGQLEGPRGVPSGTLWGEGCLDGLGPGAGSSWQPLPRGSAACLIPSYCSQRQGCQQRQAHQGPRGGLSSHKTLEPKRMGSSLGSHRICMRTGDGPQTQSLRARPTEFRGPGSPQGCPPGPLLTLPGAWDRQMPIPRALAGAKGAGGAVSPGAAVTKCHSLRLKQQKPVLSRSGGQESKIRGQLGWSPWRLGGTLFQVRATLGL